MAANNAAVGQRREAHEPKSVMRRFLEESDTFTWPEEPNQKRGSYFTFVAKGGYPRPEVLMKDEVVLGKPTYYEPDGRTQRVKQCRIKKSMQVEMRFTESFAVKALTREAGNQKDNIKEALAMTGLRHPHVAALLGTFFYWTLDNIVMFPAGVTDLADFLGCVSQKIRAEQAGPATDLRAADTVQQAHLEYQPNFSLDESLDRQLERLQGYFLCLCEGLSYLHGANVRHKDIKPENIVIDQSGNVVFVDFGTSVRYDPSQKTATLNPDALVTEEYATPERIKRKPRDKRSDVWCLGCVFVKMITLLFGKTLESFKDEISIQNPKTKSKVCVFQKSLPNVCSWLEKLQDLPFRGPKNRDMARDSIQTIRTMVAEEMEDRIDAEDLWPAFDFASSPCRDCHPRHKTWRGPTEAQRRVYDEGVEARRDRAAEDNKLEKQEVQRDTEVQAESSSGLPISTGSLKKLAPPVDHRSKHRAALSERSARQPAFRQRRLSQPRQVQRKAAETQAQDFAVPGGEIDGVKRATSPPRVEIRPPVLEAEVDGGQLIRTTSTAKEDAEKELGRVDELEAEDNKENINADEIYVSPPFPPRRRDQRAKSAQRSPPPTPTASPRTTLYGPLPYEQRPQSLDGTQLSNMHDAPRVRVAARRSQKSLRTPSVASLGRGPPTPLRSLPTVVETVDPRACVPTVGVLNLKQGQAAQLKVEAGHWKEWHGKLLCSVR